MKHALPVLFISIIFPFIGFNQLTDTTCIQSRWIALKSNEVNKDIFLSNRDSTEDIDLVFVIKRLVEKGELAIYTQDSGPYGVKGWYHIDYQKSLEDLLKDSLDHWSYNPYFEIIDQSDYPLVDEYGDPIVITSLDGTQSFVYPPPTRYVFPSKICDEIRIKESRTFNSKTNSYEFRPVGLSFYFKGSRYYRGHEKFWVDLNELFKALKNKEKHPWYNAIIHKQYQGFQYMQTSCYDEEIKY